MRLIRLLAYALAGYVAYQFARGVFHGGTPGSPARHLRAGALQDALNRGAGALEIFTQDADGAVMRHRVGRGVVH